MRDGPRFHFGIGRRSFAVAGVRGSRPFAKNAKERGTHCLADALEVKIWATRPGAREMRVDKRFRFGIGRRSFTAALSYPPLRKKREGTGHPRPIADAYEIPKPGPPAPSSVEIQGGRPGLSRSWLPFQNSGVPRSIADACEIPKPGPPASMILGLTRPVSCTLSRRQGDSHYDQRDKQHPVDKDAPARGGRPPKQHKSENAASERRQPQKRPSRFLAHAHGMAPYMPSLGVVSAPPGNAEHRP
jgi:hypothetical protein